jgi:hypothetical protein
MCGRDETSNNKQPEAINESRFLPPPLLCRQGYFILIVDVHLRSGEQVFRSVILSDLAPREGEYSF